MCLDLMFGLVRWVLGWCVAVFGADEALVGFTGGARGCDFLGLVV